MCATGLSVRSFLSIVHCMIVGDTLVDKTTFENIEMQWYSQNPTVCKVIILYKIKTRT